MLKPLTGEERRESGLGLTSDNILLNHRLPSTCQTSADRAASEPSLGTASQQSQLTLPPAWIPQQKWCHGLNILWLFSLID